MIKTVVFDFDGTLADTIPLVLSSIERLAADELHRKYSAEDYLRLRDMGITEIIIKEKIPLLKLPHYIARMRDLTSEKEKKAKPFPGIKALLSQLSKRYAVGILTSNSEEVVKEFCTRQKLKDISFIISSSPLFGKTHAMRKMLRKKGLKGNEVIYVGDEIRDIQACRKVGIRVISVTWGFNSKKGLKLENPNFLADTPQQLLAEILRM